MLSILFEEFIAAAEERLLADKLWPFEATEDIREQRSYALSITIAQLGHAIIPY